MIPTTIQNYKFGGTQLRLSSSLKYITKEVKDRLQTFKKRLRKSLENVVLTQELSCCLSKNGLDKMQWLHP